MKNIKLYELEETYHNEESSLEYPTVSYTKDTDKVWYMERPIPNQFIATYNVTSTTSTTKILGGGAAKQVKEMYIDDVKQEQVFTAYTFNTTGEHTVKCVMNDENFTSCWFMFGECYDLTSLDLSSFDTSNVTDMTEMFVDCNRLTSLDLSNFDTSKVTNMRYMFYDCNGLASLDLSNFDTSKVTYMDSMFCDCESLTSLDLSSFDTSNVKDMSYMFYQCRSLTSITFGPQANVSNVTSNDSFTYMFGDSNNMFDTLETQGTLYFPKQYTSSWQYILVYYNMISMFPPTWTAVPIDYENGETV